MQAIAYIPKHVILDRASTGNPCVDDVLHWVLLIICAGICVSVARVLIGLGPCIERRDIFSWFHSRIALTS